MSRFAGGWLAAHRFFDPAGLSILSHVFFPASRLWAAAEAGGMDRDAFYRSVPMLPHLEDRSRLGRALAIAGHAREAAKAADERWEDVLFAQGGSSEVARAAAEAARKHARHAYNMTRQHFARLSLRHVPRLKHETRSPHEVALRFGHLLADPAPIFARPASEPRIERSGDFAYAEGRDYFVRFQSPSRPPGDMVTARVHEPSGAVDPPTIIYGHGICVEFDHWNGLIDETPELIRRGYRVIRPEAPWHGRRRPEGYYGGERVLATFPEGALDALSAAVTEWSVLASFARATSKGPLVFGGVSLGAMTAQLAAERSQDWPAELRPDVLYLVTHCGSIADAIFSGAIPKLFGGLDEAIDIGWSHEEAARYLAITDPKRRLPLPSRHIVSVLGRRDVVTPFASGQALVERWCLPSDNVFILDRGHFSVPMSLVRDHRPINRLTDIVRSHR